MSEQMTGGCACGKVRYSVKIEDFDASLCHCRMCQKASGSVSVAFKEVQLDDLEWQGEPDWYESSAIALRPFCAKCGTTIGFKFREGRPAMDLTVASFDDPTRFKPTMHFGAESILRSFLNTEGLKELRCDDYQALKDKWIKATGSFPG